MPYRLFSRLSSHFHTIFDGIADGTLLPCLCHPLKLLQRDNLQIREHFRLCFSAAKDPGIHDILEDVLDHGVVEGLPWPQVDDPLIFQDD